ncbi:MAG: ABC transporter ATP-binding protein [Desulfobacterales bacterium]|nr:ABC transporter ATP-binding protein [Desulfobacterales bacterium]
MGLTLEHVTKVVEGENHLSDIHLDLKSGSRHVILGRTLAGKTSLLRIMAGLDRPTSGKLLVNGEDVTGVSVRKRSVAMVYQQFINYPSFTVYNNIASPLKVSGAPTDEIEARVMETAKVLHLEPMLDRLPSELSGGQQQRVAIARALMKDTDLLLLDEPLVNLDYKLREELLEELQAIFDQRESVVVYTTTEPSEALKLGGNIVVMDEGKVLQTGPTSNVYRNPGTVKTAELFSDPPINFFSGRIEQDKITIGQDLVIDNQAPFNTLEPGSYRFGVRPNHLYLSRQQDDDAEIQSKVEISEINGSETFIHFKFDNCQTVLHEVGVDIRKIGSDITAFVNPKKFFVYSEDGNLLISPDRQAS